MEISRPAGPFELEIKTKDDARSALIGQYVKVDTSYKTPDGKVHNFSFVGLVEKDGKTVSAPGKEVVMNVQDIVARHIADKNYGIAIDTILKRCNFIEDQAFEDTQVKWYGIKGKPTNSQNVFGLQFSANGDLLNIHMPTPQYQTFSRCMTPQNMQSISIVSGTPDENRIVKWGELQQIGIESITYKDSCFDF